MPNVNMDSALILRLFRSRSEHSARHVSTEQERRAAASAADCEEAIGVASLEDPLPVHTDLQDWYRHQRHNFDWDDLYYLSDYRPDVNFAVLANVSAAKSVLVRMYQNQYQVPTSFSVDRSFVENCSVAWLVSFLELWLVEGLDEMETVEDAIMKSPFEAHAYAYGAHADQAETSSRLRHRFEWMIIMQSGRVLTWNDFEVVRVSRKRGSILSLTTSHAVFKSGVRIYDSKCLFVPYFVRTSSLPTGLAIPPLFSLRLYSHYMGRRLSKLPTMPPGPELSAALDMKRRWERLVALEFCWSILHCAAIERRQHARVPVITVDLMDFILLTIPASMLSMDYPGGHYGSPWDTLNDLLQAQSIGEGFRLLVEEPLSNKPVAYVSLDTLYDKVVWWKEAHALLPIEHGAVLPPGMKAAKAANRSGAASTKTPKTTALDGTATLATRTPSVAMPKGGCA